MPGWLAGLFHRDRRMISRLGLAVAEQPPQLLGYETSGRASDQGVFLAGDRSHPAADGVIVRRRVLDEGVLDRFELRALGRDPVIAELVLTVECDFADLPTLRYRAALPGPVPVTAAAGGYLA
ncbi:MAG: hypothetical protein J2P32_15885, partial [Actinobacteria bacterium]|nr:hypothetical protein [Actinomycetota bacterium]